MISIIVPIYNVEEYLDRCIQSIMNQTYQEFELILIDDGSPDTCPDICERWKAKDERIIVVHQENGGLSDARNTGIKMAKGDYTVFIDSDDWIAPQYLEFLIRALEDNSLDVVECDIVRTEKFEASPLNQIYGNDTNVEIFDTEQSLKELITEKNFHQYVWNKIYKTNIIKKVLFAKGKTNEDEFWTYQILGMCRRSGHLNIPLYFYYQRSSSIMGSHYNIKRLDALEAKRIRQSYIEKYFKNLSSLSKKDLYGSCIYQGQLALRFLKKEEKSYARKIIQEIIESQDFSMKMYSTSSTKEKIWFLCSKLSFWNTCRLRNMLKVGL